MKTNATLLLAFLLLALLSSCDKDDPVTPDQPTDLEYGLGAFDNETNDNIPTGIYFGTGSVPAKHDITQYLPPVGDQGQYGTCVAWALGYNLKTMIEAQDLNLTSSQLSQASNQFSPKDLFLSIPSNERGPDCGGTYLYSALDVMQNRGVAKMNTAPYTDIQDCSQGTQSSWTSEAGNFKIENYRSVDLSINAIKEQIANDRPVGFGARLGDNFMTWDSDQVLNGHTSFDRVGQHAGHAMTIVGYDDNKGPNGAFRVVNSWSPFWGDQGFIWIDYNFFVSPDFANVAYVATNKKGDIDPNDPTDPTSSGNVDLIPWGLWDSQIGVSPRERSLSYNVYNIGTEAARASSDWAIGYVFYNAFDANDYGFLLYDYYSNDYGSPGQNAELQSGPGLSGNWWNHVDVPGGSSISLAVTGSQDNFDWAYEVPNITGYYYLVMIADVFDVLGDKDKNNNYYYITDPYGYPIYFQNGIPQFTGDEAEVRVVSTKPSGMTQAHMSPAEKNKDLRNAYTKDEIQQMLIQRKKDGSLKESLSKFRKK